MHSIAKSTLVWLQEIGTITFDKQIWQIETRNGLEWAHWNKNCRQIHGTIKTTFSNLLDTDFDNRHLCGVCGYEFLNPISNDADKHGLLGLMAKVLHDINRDVLLTTDTIHVIRAITPPAMHALLVHDETDILLSKMEQLEILPALKQAATMVTQTIMDTRGKHPLNYEAAINDSCVMGAKMLVAKDYSDDLYRRGLQYNSVATYALLNLWKTEIRDLDGAAAASVTIRNTDDYATLKTKLPEIDEIIDYWECTFNSQANRRTTKFYTVNGLSGYLKYEVPRSGRQALIHLGLQHKSVAGHWGIGALPDLAIEYLIATNYDRGPNVAVVECDYLELKQDEWENTVALWLEAQYTPNSLYKDIANAIKAGARL